MSSIIAHTTLHVLGFDALVKGNEGDLDLGGLVGHPELVLGHPVIGVPVAALDEVRVVVVTHVGAIDDENGPTMRASLAHGSHPER